MSVNINVISLFDILSENLSFKVSNGFRLFTWKYSTVNQNMVYGSIQGHKEGC